MLDSQAFIAARKAKGLSQAQLAKAAGVSQQLVTAIETGATRTTKYLLRLAQALDVPPGRIDPDWQDLEFVDSSAVPGSTVSSSRELPIHSSAEAGGGFITVTPHAVDSMPRLSPVAQTRSAYGVIVTGESMVPEFEPGDIALVNPHLPVIPETTCIFYRVRKDETGATIKRLRRVSDDTWYLRQWNPPARAKADFTLARKEWRIAHRVVGKYSRG
jgi:phage repressor protein C with HTH and peptisase S24 domain